MRPEAFFAAALWQFAREFAVVTRVGRLDTICTMAAYVATTIGVALCAANLVPLLAPGTALEGATASLQRLTGTGPVFWNIVFGAALPAVLAIARPKPIRRGPERRRVRLFLIAVGR